jgi:hypothetical protein
VTETTPAPEPIAIEGLAIPSLTPGARGGSTATGQTPSHPAVAGPKPQQGPGPDVRRRNVSIEVAIGDQTGTAAPVTKVVTLIVADRQKGSVRSSGSAVMPKDEPASMPLEHETLNVDATPTVQADDSVLLAVALEYMPRSAEPEKGGRAQLNQHMSVTLESGKPMVIYRSADPASGRRKLMVLLSNLSSVQKIVDLPNNIGGFSTFKPPGTTSLDRFDDFAIQPGQHRLLNFSLQQSSRGRLEWVFQGDSFIGLDNNRNGIGIPEPTALGLLGVGALGLLARRRRAVTA